MLEVNNLNVFYGAIHALKGISLTVGDGELVSLIGANGAGKTTTLHAISGLLPVASGSILLDGKDLQKVAPNKIISLGLAHVPEGRHVFARMTVEENLRMGAYIQRDTKQIDKNLDKERSLSDVAELVNMSESAFSHFFKKRTGMSYINYVNNQRIAKACTLLAETTLSAAEICYDCGFNNKSNFIRIFNKKKGMTPIEYRKFITQMLIKY